ncbi:MAG: OmpA family protein [Azovibrio sp.]|uniref:OmpA family protein n=1 Tax=Azovibrio sp. TaxID=1872673 RepID=UPI003C77040B
MTIRTPMLATLAVALSACTIVPERNLALEQAQDRYAIARQDNEVQTLASDELRRAGDSLLIAQQANSNRQPKATVDHLAYLSNQRILIAQETAASRAAQAVTAAASSEREKTQQDQRIQEAKGANERLARSQAGKRQSDARVEELEMQLRELNARQTPRGLVVTLGDVLFDSGHAQLLPGSVGNLSSLAEVFKRHPQLVAAIEGHADNSGDAGSNVLLSRQRAEAVKVALVSLGVEPSRLQIQAYGEKNPVASNATEAGRQLNRRVEIVFAYPRNGRLAR